MKKPMLENMSLCAIVRDEVMNPAGGITDFVKSIVPYVDEAIIVDTGSVDGTREALAEAALHYPNLKVFDHAWKGYADARNKSLEKATKGYVLVLDADERLTRADFESLRCFLQENPSESYEFQFLEVTPRGTNMAIGNSIRVFERRKTGCYIDFQGMLEWMANKDTLKRVDVPSSIQIKHFLPESEALDEKTWGWYNDIFSQPPSKTPGFSEWKAYNPLRENYR